MTIDLRGHRALVTGSTQGVGRAIAESLAAAGADVVVHGLRIDANAHAAEQACAAHGVQTALIEADLAGSTQPAVERVFELATSALPDIDLLVNNAGTYADVPFLDMTVESFERTWRLNVSAAFF